jgi:hypothetical protein
LLNTKHAARGVFVLVVGRRWLTATERPRLDAGDK